MRYPRIITAIAALGLVAGLVAAQASASDPDFDWVDEGRSVYQSNCASCHGQQGAGVPGAFPPLAEHVPDLVAPEGGRVWLVDVLLYGMVGEIDVAGTTYNGAMPGWAHLTDAQVAAVLNHISTAWGNDERLADDFVLYGPDDVAAERDKGLSPADVLALRAEVLGLATSDGADGDADGVAVALLDDSTGYFTVSQVERGRANYERHCASCHASNLRGGLHEPGLTQLRFFRTWGDRSLDSLVTYIQSQMPLGAPGSLGNNTVVDIVAFWLDYHGYPSGDTPLVADVEVLRAIPIENRR